MIFNQLHVHRTKVDFDLLDAGDVVYHPNYLILCERARNAALAAAGFTFQEMWAQGMALAVLECNSKYSRALEFAQDLAILTRTTDSTGSRLSVQQQIVFASTLDPALREPGFKSHLVEISPKNILFQANFILGSVKVRPIKAARHPAQLVQALGLQTGSK
jgi:YbgC/YbaW family acyl-CoA thioester hydrolase